MRPRRCDGLQGWDTTGDDAGGRDGALEATEGQLAPPRAGPGRAPPPQAATPARLFPRFRRLKRSSAATHMSTVGRPETQGPTRCGRNWGPDFLGPLFGFLPSHEAWSRMIRCCAVCFVPRVCLGRTRGGHLHRRPDRYREYGLGCWGKGCGWWCGWCGRRGASIVACLRKSNVGSPGMLPRV